MKIFFTRSIVIILLALITSISVSCSQQKSNLEDISETSHIDSELIEETERQYPKLTEADYGGYTFTMLYFDNVKVNTWTGIPNDISITEETGDVLADSVYLRNKAVEEKFNIKIEAYACDDAEMIKKLSASILSATNDYDAIFPRLLGLTQLVGNGYLRDIHTLNDMDISAPWWDQNSVAELSISEKLFSINSEITYIDKLATYAMFVNKNMQNDYNIEDINKLVIENKWIYDKMLEISADVSTDVNGDGVFDFSDSYGISCQNDAAYVLLHSGDIKLCGKDDLDNPVFDFINEKSIGALTKIYEFMNNDRLFFNRQKYNLTVSEAISMFIDNRTLFIIRPLQTMMNLRDMEADFSIVPIPKFYEEQENYGSSVNPYVAITMALPKIIENETRTADILEMLAAESSYSVTTTLYDTVLGHKLTRDAESVKMLDIIFSSRVYDIGCIWNFADYVTAICTKYTDDAASTAAKYESKINEKIKDLVTVVGTY